MAGGDFFERQDRARRRTALLVVLMLAAVACIVVMIDYVLYLGLSLNRLPRGTRFSDFLATPLAWQVGGGVVAVIVIGSIRRLYQLRGGGRAVAEMVGARPVDPATSDAAERRYINVVEEMAIASGTPVPRLYVLEHERGINAFVAGYRPREAVMVATRGALEELTRDQLQGVAGHEFSHILNGDMRINVRLIAILAGILAIAVLGRGMLRVTTLGTRRDGSSGRGNAAPVLLLGLALLVIGSIGAFFGNLIKAAVSRQREFLADAASVQFTRNPAGIAGALWRIHEHARGSRVLAARAEEASHMFFGASRQPLLGRLLATHPPLEARIRAVDPHFFGKLAGARIRERLATRAPTPEVARPPAVALGAAAVAAGVAAGVAASGASLAARVGGTSPEHLAYAARLRDHLPEAVRAALRRPRPAALLVYSLLLGEVAPARLAVARALLAHQLDAERAAEVVALGAALDTVEDRRARLAALDLAMPALRLLEPGERRELLAVSAKLIRVDRRITPFELALQHVLAQRLDPDAEQADAVRFRSFEPVLEDIRVLLSGLARVGADGPRAAARAFLGAVQGFARQGLNLAPEEECGAERIGEALGRLAGLAPLLKRPLIQACAACVLADGRVTVAEFELVRAVCAALDCPMPPLLEGEVLATRSHDAPPA